MRSIREGTTWLVSISTTYMIPYLTSTHPSTTSILYFCHYHHRITHKHHQERINVDLFSSHKRGSTQNAITSARRLLALRHIFISVAPHKQQPASFFACCMLLICLYVWPRHRAACVEKEVRESYIWGSNWGLSIY